ncbi:hypothetical protein [Oceanobacillus saliphilus]|uniref:hypothetical protein n=1 Tax=Oceanobacillus saliphilus TaxID=2925834 RepID=UPI00201DEC1A|nr:hypothetical protein [Oceanobacillus saliphilus]
MVIKAEKLNNNIKTNILKTIETELDRLNDKYNSEINFYEIKVDELKGQVFSLSGELHSQETSIVNLEKDNSRLKAEIDILQNLLLENKNTTMIESYLLQYKEKLGNKWLEKCTEIIESNIQKKYHDQAAYFISFLNNHLPVTSLNDYDYSLLHELSASVFLEWIDLDDIDYELNFINLFKFLRANGEVRNNIPIKSFFIDNLIGIKENVFLSNSPQAIIEMIRCYMTFDLTEELHDIFDDLMGEWLFVEHDLSEDQLSYILILSYYLGRESDLLKQPGIADKNIKELPDFLSENERNYLLPNISQNNSSVNSKTKEVKREIEYKDEENHEVFLQRITKLPNKKNRPNTNVHFENVQVKIAIYRNKSANIVYEYIKTNVQKIRGSMEYFITKNQLKSLSKNRPGYWIDLEYVDKGFNFISKERFQLIELARPVKKVEHDSFKWPVTEINPESGNAENEPDLNTKSELRKLGYQISGMSRIKRWEILEKKAVPQLGLKKVAYTIAFLVRGRKAMKNGLIRNQNSITEWEYDLQRLKDTFYKNNFFWPSTKVNN